MWTGANGQGLLDEAEVCFREALRLDSTFAASWVALARLQAERGDFDSACESARAALAHRPRLADAYWRLAITLNGRLPDVEIQAMQRTGRLARPDRSRPRLLHFGGRGIATHEVCTMRPQFTSKPPMRFRPQ